MFSPNRYQVYEPTWVWVVNFSTSSLCLSCNEITCFVCSRHCSNPFNFLQIHLGSGTIALGHLASEWSNQDSNAVVWLVAYEPRIHANLILPVEFHFSHWVFSPNLLCKHVPSSFKSSSPCPWFSSVLLQFCFSSQASELELLAKDKVLVRCFQRIGGGLCPQSDPVWCQFCLYWCKGSPCRWHMRFS